MFRRWLLRPVLTALKGIHMDMQALATALTGVQNTLTTIADDDSNIVDQLNKAKDEIVAAVGGSGQTTPEVDAIVANLQAIADTLSTRQDSIKSVAQNLDDLNPDAPPAPAPEPAPAPAP